MGISAIREQPGYQDARPNQDHYRLRDPFLEPPGSGAFQRDAGAQRPQQPAHPEGVQQLEPHRGRRHQQPEQSLARQGMLQLIHQRHVPGAPEPGKDTDPQAHQQDRGQPQQMAPHFSLKIPVPHALDHRVRVQLRGGRVAAAPDVEGPRQGADIFPPQLSVGIRHLRRRRLLFAQQGLEPVAAESDGAILIKDSVKPPEPQQVIALPVPFLQPGLHSSHVIELHRPELPVFLPTAHRSLPPLFLLNLRQDGSVPLRQIYRWLRGACGDAPHLIPQPDH